MLGNRGDRDAGTLLMKNDDEYENNPVMQLVKTTLADMVRIII